MDESSTDGNSSERVFGWQSSAMRVFVTVGSTKFDSLVQAVLSDDVLHAFNEKGYTDIVVQCGNSQFDPCSGLTTDQSGWTLERDGVRVDMWKFKPSLEEEYNKADLVVSHAGPS